MICLTLTEQTLKGNLKLIESSLPHIDLVELRMDHLSPGETKDAFSFADKTDLPVILTCRRKAEDGNWEGDEDKRLELLQKAAHTGSFAYIDLEEDLLSMPWEDDFRAKGGRIIRSLQGTEGVPQNLAQRVRSLARNKTDLPRAQVFPDSTSSLASLVKAFSELKDLEKILLGMGPWGYCAKILAKQLGSYLTLTSAKESEQDKALITPVQLCKLYRYRETGKETKVAGVIGNPVMHSKSPHIHNPAYTALGLDRVYIPFQTDDPGCLLGLAEELNITGLSVTVPHKGFALERRKEFNIELDPSASEIGSSNTLVRTEKGWKACNTDANGFLFPLKKESVQPQKALVIGAGGASRAVVYALTTEGWDVSICNRTFSKAETLAQTFGAKSFSLASLAEKKGFDLIVQTTKAGMAPLESEDPSAGYEFTGSETVYDIVYAPSKTCILKRAEEAGCQTIGGMIMLKAQAWEQFKLFTGSPYPEHLREAEIS